jgi:hypothetical protein
MGRWVRDLADPLPESPADKAAPLRRLVADLLANGERRIRHHQYEDALLRAYRVLELVGQMRLFAHGLDSAALDPQHEAVRRLQDRLAKSKSTPLARSRDGKTLLASREQVARLLMELNDPLGKRLLDLGQKGGIKPRDRNQSVLVHGFRAVGPADDAPLRDMYSDLETLLVEDAGPEARDHLRAARALDFSDA